MVISMGGGVRIGGSVGGEAGGGGVLVKAGLRPGPRSMDGLAWLARVGPAPGDPWRMAMGWSERVAYSHAERLRAAGWLARCSTSLGNGALLYATAGGVGVAGVAAAPVRRAPAPVWWEHCRACAWTAAWLTLRDREMLAPREILVDDSWRGELEWQERSGLRRRAHRPDFVAGLPGGARLPVEVELASKSKARLRAVLSLHAAWVAAGKSSAVVYVCGSRAVAERVCSQAAEVGLERERNTVRVELLETIRAQALAARADPAQPPAESDGRSPTRV
jgi:hypothetical protein